MSDAAYISPSEARDYWNGKPLGELFRALMQGDIGFREQMAAGISVTWSREDLIRMVAMRRHQKQTAN